MTALLNPYESLFNTKKINVNASDSPRNLVAAFGEAIATRSYDLTANPTGSFRGINVDPLVKILSGAPAITQPLYGANLKVELNGTTGTGNKTGGVFAINAYSLVSGSGHTVDKNVGVSTLADVGGGLTGTTITENTSLEVVGVGTKGTTTITNARSQNIVCPNHGANRRGLLIQAEQITGLAVGVNNRSFENLGTSNFVGQAIFNSQTIFNGVGTFNAQINGTGGMSFTGVCSIGLTTAVTLRSLGDFNFAGGAVPATATSLGTQGDIRWDANFIYVCISTNTWKRSPLSTW
jgi:hypothetical protein